MRRVRIPLSRLFWGSCLFSLLLGVLFYSEHFRLRRRIVAAMVDERVWAGGFDPGRIRWEGTSLGLGIRRPFGAAVRGRHLQSHYIYACSSLSAEPTRSETGIHEAVEDGDLTRVKALLQGDPTLVNCHLPRSMSDVYDHWGQAPLHVAARRDDEELVRRLLKHGADIDAPSGEGTPLHVAVLRGHRRIIELLLSRGANVQLASSPEYGTPLHVAAARDRVEVVRLLLRQGAEVNARGRAGRTPLHEAVDKLHLASASALLAAGAEVNYRTNTTSPAGFSALHCAASRGSVLMLKLLLEHGADIHARDGWNCSALYWAAEQRHAPAAAFLFARGAQADVFEAAMLDMRDRLVGLTDQDRSAIGRRCRRGRSPLHYAAEHGSVNCVRYLLSVGAEVDIKVARIPGFSDMGMTPLHFAARAGQTGTAKVLMESGANVNARDNWGCTPLHLAGGWWCRTKATWPSRECSSRGEPKLTHGAMELRRLFTQRPWLARWRW